MKKIIPILVVGVLVLSGLGAVAVTEADGKLMKEDYVLLSAPIFKEIDDYLTVDLKEATSLLMDTGKPMLPFVTKVYTFPLGTKIDDVVVTFSETNEQILSKKIMSAPEPVPLLSNEMVSKKLSEDIIDKEVYSSSELYPGEKYIVRTGVGLKDNEHVIYLTVRCYPAQYSPAENTIYVANSIDIDVTYQPPKNPVVFLDEYDMVIITPEKFEAQLEPLVEHKNAMGIDTTIKTVEDIYSEYSGRDEPEDIKLFIKDAIEDWGIDYVLLFGGRKGQSFDWYIPERRSNNNDGSYETGYGSDLYYADIYKMEGNETVFEDWDSNENDVFAEWKGFNKDVMDFYPDVAVGRIPCRYSSQADIVINKIITYETTADDSWFKKAFVISGDTSPPARSSSAILGIYEGEISTDVTVDWLEGIGFDVEKLWTSLGTFTGPKDVINAINAGSGFIHFAGHASPAYWGNFLPDAETEDEMVDGLLLKHMRQLRNGEELPVVVVGGCHNSQFNTTMSNIIAGIKEYGIMGYFFQSPFKVYYMEWVPACWSSWLLLKKGGGSIGTIGNAGLGYGYINYPLEGLGGWINPQFFDAYANQSIDILGEAHSQAITDYIDIIGRVNIDQIDRKTIEQWVLLGDPSLKIGGY